MKTVEIYFNDLKEEKQKELLDVCGYKDSKDGNWDVNICPIAYFDVEEGIDES